MSSKQLLIGIAVVSVVIIIYFLNSYQTSPSHSSSHSSSLSSLSSESSHPSDLSDSITGNWKSFKYSGNEFGPVTIASIGYSDGLYTYYIFGGSVPNQLMRYLTVDKSLSCSLPRQGINNFGTAIITNGKAVSMGAGSVVFTR